MVRVRWKQQLLARSSNIPADGDLLHIDRRLSMGLGESREIQHGQSQRSGNPESAIRRNGRVGLTGACPGRRQAIGGAERRVIERLIRGMPSIQAARREPEKTKSAEPQ